MVSWQSNRSKEALEKTGPTRGEKGLRDGTTTRVGRSRWGSRGGGHTAHRAPDARRFTVCNRGAGGLFFEGEGDRLLCLRSTLSGWTDSGTTTHLRAVVEVTLGVELVAAEAGEPLQCLGRLATLSHQRATTVPTPQSKQQETYALSVSTMLMDWSRKESTRRCTSTDTGNHTGLGLVRGVRRVVKVLRDWLSGRCKRACHCLGR